MAYENGTIGKAFYEKEVNLKVGEYIVVKTATVKVMIHNHGDHVSMDTFTNNSSKMTTIPEEKKNKLPGSLLYTASLEIEKSVAAAMCFEAIIDFLVEEGLIDIEK